MTGPIPTKARQEIAVRDNSQCRRCGMRGYEIHHRKRRREGGHGLENLVLLCRPCHAASHSDPPRARSTGFIVPTWVSEAWTVPLKMFAGWGLLLPDGHVLHLSQTVDADALHWHHDNAERVKRLHSEDRLFDARL